MQLNSNVTDKSNTTDINVDEFLSKVKKLEWNSLLSVVRDPKATSSTITNMKQNLIPCINPHFSFEPGHRDESHIVGSTELLMLDLEFVDDKRRSINKEDKNLREQTKKNLFESDKNVYAIFNSTTQKGYVVVYKVPIINKLQYDAYIKIMSSKWHQIDDTIAIDKLAFTNPRFVSSDADLLIREDVKILPLPEVKEAPKKVVLGDNLNSHAIGLIADYVNDNAINLFNRAYTDIDTIDRNGGDHTETVRLAYILRDNIKDFEKAYPLYEKLTNFIDEPDRRLKRRLKEFTHTWNSSKTDRNPISVGTLIKMATTAGWYDPLKDIELDILILDLDRKDYRAEFVSRYLSIETELGRLSYAKRASILMGVTPKSVQRLIKGYRRDDLENTCQHMYLMGNALYEFVETPEGYHNTPRTPQYVSTLAGSDALNWINANHAMVASCKQENRGAGLEESSYNTSVNTIIFNHAMAPSIISDNGYVNDWISQRFNSYTEFAKDWIAYYAFSNYKKLPTIVISGDRGTGKTFFADFLSYIYPTLSGSYAVDSTFNEFLTNKLAIIEESEHDSNEDLYKQLKLISGSEYNSVNIKYGAMFQARNNLSVVVLSNKKIPLYLRANEAPRDGKNNQFFVYNFPPLNVNIDNDIYSKMQARIGNWLRTEIYERYKALEARINKSSYRYCIDTPITDEALKLYQNSASDVEGMLRDLEEDHKLLDVEYYCGQDISFVAGMTHSKVSTVKKKMVELEMIKSTKRAYPLKLVKSVHFGILDQDSIYF